MANAMRFPPWWEVAQRWGFVHRSPSTIRRRAQRIRGDDLQARRWLDELLSSYPLDDQRPSELYDSLYDDLHHPIVRYTGPFFDPAFLAACVTYRTVVIGDPVWIPHRLWMWSRRMPRGQERREAQRAVAGMAAFLVEDYFPLIVPLALEGVLAFDAFWGPVSCSQQIWDRVPGEVVEAARSAGSYEREVLAETVWATARAEHLDAAVGTGDHDVAQLLRHTLSQTSNNHYPPLAREIPVLMPYMTADDSTAVVHLRSHHMEELTRFRSALRSMTAEMRQVNLSEATGPLMQAVVRDHIEGAASKLRRSARSTAWKAGVATVAAGALTMSVANVLVAHGGLAQSLAPVVGAGTTLSAALASLRAEQTQIRLNDMYVLWHASRRLRKKSTPKIEVE